MSNEKTLREHLREAGRAKSPAKAAASRVNGAKGGRGRLTIVTVTGDDGAEQTFRRDQLGLAEDHGYIRDEWRAALDKSGYDLKGIVSID